MVVVVLPPEAIPTQITAKAAISKLGDHLQAFLAHNNIHGYLHDPSYVLRDDRIADILLQVGIQESLTYIALKDLARKIKLLSNKAIKHGHSLELLARALGYKTWHDCVHSMPETEVIVNMWLDPTSTQVRLFDTKEVKRGTARQVYDNPEVKRLIRLNRQRKIQ